MVLLGVLLERAFMGTLPFGTRDATNNVSQHTLDILTTLSLAFASISVASTLSTLYWFIKMRKSFRHELIMLLIQSDFIKSAAFVVFPIVSLIRGTVESDSAFCQISGFGLAVGIESSDIAVLLIALHSVMYIFRPKSGLYPYRQIAYLTYYLFPVVTASLAFIDGSGYENLGHYCYLRTDRGWRRMALSWIPRYIVGTAIVVIYAFIYIYIRRRMDDYGRRSSGSFDHPWIPSRVPPLPSISYYGLLSSSPNSRRVSVADSIVAVTPHQSSLSSASSLWVGSPKAPASPAQSHRISPYKQPIDWNWSGFRQPRSSVDNPFPDETEDPLSPNPNPVATPAPVHAPTASPPHEPDEHSDSSSITLPRSFWCRPTSISGPHRSTADHPQVQRPNVPLPNIITISRKGPPPPSSAHPVSPQRLLSQYHSDTTSRRHHLHSATTNAPSTSAVPACLFEDAPGAARANRDKIRRQLRSLFAYPLVYMIVWVFPFVSHVMGYDDAVRSGDPLWLLVLGIISLCAQGTVDCALFAVRERPWRHAARAGLGLWEALERRFVVNWELDWGGPVGRTREEMMVDGRLARERRDEEIVFERARGSSAEQGLGRGPGVMPKRKKAREWWDVEEDG